MLFGSGMSRAYIFYTYLFINKNNNIYCEFKVKGMPDSCPTHARHMPDRPYTYIQYCAFPTRFRA